MSLQDEFKEELYDIKHKPRLTYARSYFLGYSDKDPDLKGLEKFYGEWRDYNEYIVVQKQSDNLRIKGEIDKKTLLSNAQNEGTMSTGGGYGNG